MDPRRRDELEPLLEALMEGSLDEAGFGRLDRLLLGDPEAQRYYLRRIDLHHSLHWYAAGKATHRSLAALRVTRTERPVLRAVRIAAVALLCLSLGAVLAVRREAAAPPGPSVAMLAGRTLEAGPFRLEGGSARIAWNGGAETLVNGPAHLDLTGPERGRLHSGSLTLGVPPGTSEFHLAAPGLDLSTRDGEFGLRAGGRGAVLLQVYEGEVLARVQGTAAGVPRTIRLTRDESLRIDADGTLTAHIIGDAPVFARLRRPHDPDIPAIANPSFEYPKAGPSGSLAAAGWLLQVHPLANVDNMDVDSGAGVIEARAAGPRAPAATHGEQWGYLSARTFPDGRKYHTTMHQAVGRVAAGRYVLTATLARPPGVPLKESLYRVGLYSGTPESGPVFPLEEWQDPVVLKPGEQVTVEVAWRCPTDHPNTGQTLYVRFASVAGSAPGVRKVLVDDVRLTKEPR
jgi:hypothetical protein